MQEKGDGSLRYSDEEFTRIMNVHGDAVLRLCYVRLADRSAAEDVFQEVFISLYRAVKKPDEEYLLPWLIRVACNKCTSYLRSRKNYAELSGNEAAGDTTFDNTVENAVLSLDEPQRSAIYLFYYQQLTTREIAEHLGLKEGNVRVVLHRGREKLREMLKEDYFE